mmetsp:Transcript_458/g.1058  ORF Transcript_458/g.1058 Transcript_458/m.1058 type:complete len:206 (-) Transcript_458:444-1061(-)
MPMPELAAEPTPEAESSTATQFAMSEPSDSAASRYTEGSGLKRGGSKSLSPLWIFSGLNQGSRPAAMTETGTRGLPLVVAIANLRPMSVSPFNVSLTPGQLSAIVFSASTVSSFCWMRKSSGSVPPLRIVAKVSRPKRVRALSTNSSTVASSVLAARTSSSGGRPASARDSLHLSTMNSKAFPAFSRMNSLMYASDRSSTLTPGK